jgi:hypothetical protein
MLKNQAYDDLWTYIKGIQSPEKQSKFDYVCCESSKKLLRVKNPKAQTWVFFASQNYNSLLERVFTTGENVG